MGLKEKKRHWIKKSAASVIGKGKRSRKGKQRKSNSSQKEREGKKI